MWRGLLEIIPETHACFIPLQYSLIGVPEGEMDTQRKYYQGIQVRVVHSEKGSQFHYPSRLLLEFKKGKLNLEIPLTLGGYSNNF